MSSAREPNNLIARLFHRCAALFLERPIAGLLLVLALALFTRLLGISSRPIWYDEAFTVLFAEKGPSRMMMGTIASVGAAFPDVHPLGYYLILWEWMRLFGESLVSVRALSILASVGAAIPLYLLARAVSGTGTALAAGLIYAVAPFQVHYGQEIRMYAFLCLWLMLATYCYWRGDRGSRWAWWIGFAVFATLAVFTQYLAVFYLAPLAAWPLITRNWRTGRNLALAAGLSVLLSLPWLIRVPAQLSKVSTDYWIGRPPLFRLLTLLLTFVTNLPLPGWQLAVGLFVALALAAVTIMQTLRILRHPGPNTSAVVWIAFLSLAPPIVLFAFSQWIPLYLERALLPSGAVFCIWLGWAISKSGLPTAARLVAISLLLLGCGMGLYQHVTDTSFPYAPFAQLAGNLESRREAGDAIVHSSKLSLLPTMYFDRGLPETYIADPPGSPVDTLAPDTRENLGIQSEPDIQAAARGAGRVWYILFDESNLEYVQAGYPRHPDLTWLMQRYQLVDLSHWGGLSLYLFSRAQ